MKRAVSLGVYVVALLAIQLTSFAQDPLPQYSPGFPQIEVLPQTGFIPQTNSLAKFAAKRTGDAKMPVGAFNGFAQIRQTPDLGDRKSVV